MWDRHQQHLHMICLIAFVTSVGLPKLCEAAKATKGDLRCYCNLPVCVATGYMCKSSSSVCFSEVPTMTATGNGGGSRSRHGCVELLHQPWRDACHKRAPNSKAHSTASSTSSSSTPAVVTGAVNTAAVAAAVGKLPLLMCCREDMCNYVDNLDIKIHVNAKVNHSRTVTGKRPSMTDDDAKFMFGSAGAEGAAEAAASRRNDVWFKAAVIAVPIAGAFILVLLVLLAVHVLRKDNRRQRRRMYESGVVSHPHFHPHHHHLHQHHHHHPGLMDVKEYGQKDSRYLLVSNDIRSIGSLTVATTKKNVPSGGDKSSRNVYKNVNIVITRDNGFACDKSKPIADYDEDKPLNDDAFHTATVTWAEMQRNKSSTPV